MKCAARGSLKIQDAKIRHLHTIAQCCWVVSSQLRHILTIGKLVKQQYLLHMSSLMVNFGPLTAEIGFMSVGHPSEFQRVSCLGFVTAPALLN